MNPEVKALWTKELLSGEYEQGQNYLTSFNEDTGEEEDCCLGVMCKAAIKAGLKLKVEVVDGLTYYDDEARILPEAVREWAGIEDANPKLGAHHTAAEWNDNEGASFKQIASLVDAFL